jgi:hypothetical protein
VDLRGYISQAGDDEECIGRQEGICDSGASAHMTSDRSLFHGVVRGECLPVTGMDGIKGGLFCTGVGSGSIVIDGVRVRLSRLHYVPGMARTLVSASELVEDGHGISLLKVHGVNVMNVHLAGGATATMPVKNGLYMTGVGHDYDDAIWLDEINEDATVLCGHVAVGGSYVGNTYIGDLDLGELLHLRP